MAGKVLRTGLRGRHGWLTPLVAALVIVAAGLPSAAAAAASYVHSFSISGPPPGGLGGRTSGLAVDNSNGPSAHDVYVTDPDNHRVVSFDPSGAFVLMFGDGVNETTGGDVCTAASGDVCGPGEEAAVAGGVPGAFREPEYVAVDGSGGPSAGTVYVSDGDVVMKFDRLGSPISTWGTDGAIDLNGLWITGVAVAADGRLVVATRRIKFQDGDERLYSTLDEFDQGGAPTGSVDIAESNYGLAIDAVGNRYLVGSGAEAVKIGPTGATLARYQSLGQAWGVAVDPGAGLLYATEGNGGIGVFDISCSEPSCTAIERFGYQEAVGGYWPRALALDLSTDTLYTLGSEYWSPGEVAVFRPPGALPEATTREVARPSRRTAVLSAAVGPGAAGPVTGCHFEYVERLELEQRGWTEATVVPCAEAPPFSASLTVTAPITGFEAGRIYHYRVVAANPAGRRTGVPQKFESGTLIEGATGAAIGVTATEATLTGLVDPDPNVDAVNCYFEYVEVGSLAVRQPRVASCSPPPPYAGPRSVSAAASRLEPGTAYRYRLVAWDTWGTAVAAERTFATPSLPTSPPEPVVPEFERRRGPKPRRTGKVRCSAKACVRAFEGASRPRTWTSPKFPDTYGWLFSVYKGGESLHHTKAVGGCLSTFRGRGMIATLNGCQGRFKLTYIGRGRFSIRWRVFERCRCAGTATPQAALRAARRSR